MILEAVASTPSFVDSEVSKVLSRTFDTSEAQLTYHGIFYFRTARVEEKKDFGEKTRRIPGLSVRLDQVGDSKAEITQKERHFGATARPYLHGTVDLEIEFCL